MLFIIALWSVCAFAEPDDAAPVVVDETPVVLASDPAPDPVPLYRLIEPAPEDDRRMYHPLVDLAHWLTFWVNEGERMAATIIEITVLLSVLLSVPVNHAAAHLGFKYRLIRRRDEDNDANEEIKLLRIQVVELRHDRAVAEKRVNLLESHLTKVSKIGSDQADLLKLLLDGGESGNDRP